jgi:hypothetical protein
MPNALPHRAKRFNQRGEVPRETYIPRELSQHKTWPYQTKDERIGQCGLEICGHSI